MAYTTAIARTGVEIMDSKDKLDLIVEEVSYYIG
jgi:hypothetical protein